MPITVHKMLIHVGDIIMSLNVPASAVNEEPQEIRHKYLKRYREHSTMKMSRLRANTDLAHKLWTASDPLISSMRKTWIKKKKRLQSRKF